MPGICRQKCVTHSRLMLGKSSFLLQQQCFSASWCWVRASRRWTPDAVFRDSGLILASLIAMLALLCLWRQSLQQQFFGNSHHFAEASSVLGIILICASAAAFTSTDWPGAQTLLPVLGTAMVIAATPASTINRALCRQPLVFVGGISYPLYLWHWPAIVIWRLLNPEAGAIETAVPLVVAVVLAWLTKVLLEDPVRFGKLGRASFPRPHLPVVAAGLAIAASLGAFAFATQGLPSRIAPQLQAIGTWSETEPAASWRPGRCYYPPESSTESSSECTPLKRSGVPLILLWGDSHAAALYPGLVSLKSRHELDIIQWTAAGCPPTTRRYSQESATCSARRATALKKLTHLNPDAILIAGAWELYLEKGESQAGIIRSLEETVRQLKADGDKEIVIFGPGPTWNNSLAIDLFRFMVAKGITEIPERYGHAFGPAWHLDAAMADEARALGVHYVSVLNYFCNKSGCRTVGDRTKARPDLLFSDSNHLSVSGSEDLITHSNLHIF